MSRFTDCLPIKQPIAESWRDHCIHLESYLKNNVNRFNSLHSTSDRRRGQQILSTTIESGSSYATSTTCDSRNEYDGDDSEWSCERYVADWLEPISHISNILKNNINIYKKRLDTLYCSKHYNDGIRLPSWFRLLQMREYISKVTDVSVHHRWNWYDDKDETVARKHCAFNIRTKCDKFFLRYNKWMCETISQNNI